MAISHTAVVQAQFHLSVTLSYTSYTAASGDDRLLFVHVTCNQEGSGGNLPTITAPTYGGTTLTAVVQNYFASSTDAFNDCFMLRDASIPSGANAFGFSEDFVSDHVFLTIMTLTGVDQTNPIDATASKDLLNTLSSSLTITTSVTDARLYVTGPIEAFSGVPSAAPISAWTGGTEQWDVNSSLGSSTNLGWAGGYEDRPTPGALEVGFVWSNNGSWQPMNAISIRPAAVAASGPFIGSLPLMGVGY